MAPLGDKKKKIQIGLAAPISGENSAYGLSATKATNLVVDKVNASCGVLGPQVVVVASDDLCSAKYAVRAANRLVHQGVISVVGHARSSAAEATTLGIYKGARTLSVFIATRPKLTQGTTSNDRDQIEVGVRYTLDVLKTAKLAITHDGEGICRRFS